MHENPSKSSIKIIPYRTFVGSHPQQYFYYKPIHDALDYAPSPVEFPDNVVLVEGKTDFFAIKYFFDQKNSGKLVLNIFPGGGAGSLDPLISMLFGWGKNFIILVDSDSAGENQKRRYKEKFESIVNDRVFSFLDIFGSSGEQIESIIANDDKENLRVEFFPVQKKLSKKHLHMAMQELIAARRTLEFSDETLQKFEKIHGFLAEKLRLVKVE